MAGDDTTGEALAAALVDLCKQPMRRLTSKYINADFLHELLSPDAAGTLLQWLDDPVGERGRVNDAEWRAFVAQCRADFGFNPETDGELKAAELLGYATGAWEHLWGRFADTPGRYAGIRERLLQAQPHEMMPLHREAWPGINLADEDQLRTALRDFEALTRTGALSELTRLEQEHGTRRGSVWAELGEAPLANALKHLVDLAEQTAVPPTGSDVAELKSKYSDSGWQADRALLNALGAVESDRDVAAVTAAARILYIPWAHQAALNLQAAVGPMANAGTYSAGPPSPRADGVATVFVDGLRLDLAHALDSRLEAYGLSSHLDVELAALPTLTETAKPTLIPVGVDALTGGEQLNAARAESGAKASIGVLQSLMAAGDVQVLDSNETGDPAGSAWTEAGEVDHKGHDRGIAFTREVDGEIDQIARRIQQLIKAGWTEVRLVTDHGWLLIPGELDKIELSSSVYEPGTRKGRCARLKPGADAGNIDTVPWHWDRTVRIAVAPGIGCFTSGQVYEHGGVSPQECFVPRMQITAGTSPESESGVTIGDVTWAGLRCRVNLLATPSGVGVDIRTAAADASTSIASASKETTGAGTVSLLITNEDLEGTTATLVIVGKAGELLAQRQVTIGGG